jgi:type I restriction enzyme, S subunit
MIPKLRFPEFSDSMKYSTVKSLSEKLNVGFVGTCEPYFTSEKEGVLLLRTGNIKGVKIDLASVRYVTSEFHVKNEKSKVEPLDLLLARHGGKGEICLVPKDFQVANCLNIVILRTNKCYLDPYYFRYLYSTHEVQKQIYAFTAGSTQSVINTSAIGKLRVYYPSIAEQKKTAVFFDIIDQKINLLTKKKEALETYKKGLMQKIFSQELRFKREDGTDYPEWKKVTLGSSCKILRGKGLPKSEISSDGSYKCIHYGELFTFYREVIPFVESLTDNTDGIPSKSGDILMPSSDVTPNGLMTASMIKEEKVFLGGDINVIRPNETMHQEEYSWDSAFLSFYLNSIPKILMRLISGTTVKHLYSKDLNGIELFQPTKNEQELYSSLFLSINAKIEIIEKQIFHTQNLKKGLLQQMFV